MPKPKVRVGKDAKGNMSIKIRIAKDDPIRPYIIALAQKAASKIQEPDGFSEEKEPETGTPQELEDLVLGLLPPELKQELLNESVKVKNKVMDEVLQSDLSGVFSLMTGNIWDQQLAVKENPNLEPLSKALGGTFKKPIEEALGDTILADHVKSEIKKGTFDNIIKPTQDSQPEPPHQP